MYSLKNQLTKLADNGQESLLENTIRNWEGILGGKGIPAKEPKVPAKQLTESFKKRYGDKIPKDFIDHHSLYRFSKGKPSLFRQDMMRRFKEWQPEKGKQVLEDYIKEFPERREALESEYGRDAGEYYSRGGLKYESPEKVSKGLLSEVMPEVKLLRDFPLQRRRTKRMYEGLKNLPHKSRLGTIKAVPEYLEQRHQQELQGIKEKFLSQTESEGGRKFVERWFNRLGDRPIKPKSYKDMESLLGEEFRDRQLNKLRYEATIEAGMDPKKVNRIIQSENIPGFRETPHNIEAVLKQKLGYR